MPHTYKNLIFTNHAYNRLNLRSISNFAIYDTVRNPDKKHNKSGDSIKYIKKISGRNYHVVATYKSDQKKYLVISAWVRGEDDKVSFIWQVITLPFKIVLWIIKFLLKTTWIILKKLW